MLVTNDEELATKCQELKNLCFKPGKRFIHEDLGWNYRMTNLQAALGVAQLEQLGTFVDRKREIGAMYHHAFSAIEGISLSPVSTDYADNIYWVNGLVIDKDHHLNAEDAMKKMGDAKIGTRPFFYPMHLQPVFKNMGLFLNESYPVSEHMAEKGFYVPSGLGLADEDIQTVIEKVKNIFA